MTDSFQIFDYEEVPASDQNLPQDQKEEPQDGFDYDDFDQD